MSPYLRSSSAQLLAFPKENSGDDGLAKSHFGNRKNFFLHQWLALSERYCSPLSASSLTTSMTSCWVLEAQTSWSFIWKKHIYYYLVQDTYSGNFPVNKENSNLVKSRLLSSLFDYALTCLQAKPQYWLNFLGCHEYYKSHPLLTITIRDLRHFVILQC